jgi:hypothetical protein
MRWHGFDKVNYKGLKQRRGLGRTLTKQGSVPAEIVGRDRRRHRRYETVDREGERAEFSRGGCRGPSSNANDSVRLAFGRWHTGIGDQDVVLLRCGPILRRPLQFHGQHPASRHSPTPPF